MTSNITTSPSCLRPMRWASVPPIWPAPINAILLRAMVGKLSIAEAAERGRVWLIEFAVLQQYGRVLKPIVYTLYQQTLGR